MTDDLTLVQTHCDILLSSHQQLAEAMQLSPAYSAGFEDAILGVKDFLAQLQTANRPAPGPVPPSGPAADVDASERPADDAPQVP